MPSGYFDKKNDVADLRSRLQSSLMKKDAKACRSAIKKIIQHMTFGVDVSELFKDVIMACVTNDIIQKKLVYLYICSCAESNSGLALLTVNTLVKDATTDHNPMVRGLALRSMLNMRLHMIVEHVKSPLLLAMDDRSSYVRRTAVIGCLKLYHLAPDQFEDLGLEERLKQKLDDPNAQVAMNAFLSLEEVLRDYGGLSLTKNLVQKLLSRLPELNEWSQCILLGHIVRYKPLDEDEVFQYLNFLDDRLNHTNKGVVLAAINVFLHFTKNMDYLKADIFERIRSPILSILNSAISEISFATLKNISVLIKMKPRLFHNDYKFFFLRTNDPIYVCHQKLVILTDIVTEGNMTTILEELRQYVSNPELLISSQAVKSIGRISLNNSFALEEGANILLELLKFGEDHIIDNSLQCLQELMVNFSSISQLLLPEMSNIWKSVEHYSAGKAAIVWMYGEYGEDIPSSPYKLEELVNSIEEIDSVSVKLNLLIAIMKLFFKRPPECQKSLGKMLKFCIDEEENMDIRDRALLFYRLLRHDKGKAKEIVFTKDNGPTYHDKTADIIQHTDFRFREFNTLSVIYERSSSFLNDKHQKANSQFGNEEAVSPYHEKEEKVTNKYADVPVENFFDLNEDVKTTSETTSFGFVLDANFNLEAEEFKSKWFAAQNIKSFTEEMTVAPEHHEILNIMQEANIKCRAANQPSSPKWKFFFYAKQVNVEDLYLIELIIELNPTPVMKVQVKSPYTETIQHFVDFYRKLFIGRWIALT